MNNGTGKKSPHILILEDDAAHRDLALRAFREDPQTFRISSAGNIREARQLIGRDPPDLILADWLLPDGKGIDILPRTDGLVTVPLVIMTSHGTEQVAVEIMKSGAIDYVVKSSTMFHELPHIARNALRDWENIRQRQQAEQEKHNSEKRLADIIGFLPDAVIAIDFEGRVIAWNKAMEEITGVPAAEMLGKGDYEYSIPLYGERRPILTDLVLKDDAEIRKKYPSVQREGEKLISESFLPAAYGGRGMYCWGTATPLYDNAGNRVGAIETIRDITERRRTEEALKESENRFRQIAENVGEWIWEVDADGLYTYSSSAVEKILGYRPEEIVGKVHFFDLFAPDVKEELTKSALEAFAAKRSFRDFENPNLHKNGNRVILETRGVPRLDERGGFLGYRGADMDITERTLAEEALQKSEERLRLAQAAAHAGSWEWDLTTNENIWSDELWPLYGLEINSVTPSYDSWRDTLHPDDRPRIDKDVTEAVRNRAELNTEWRTNPRNGPVRWLMSRGKPLRDAEGNVKRLVGIVMDITGRKQAEQNLRESEEKFRALVYGAGIGVGYWSPDGILLYLNEVSIKRLNAKEGDFIGKTAREIFGEAKGEMYLERLRQASASVKPLEFEDLTSLPSGEGWYLSVYSRIVSPDGGLMGIQVLSLDITDRKNAENLRIAYETRLDSAMEIGSLAWWEMDLPGGEIRFDARKATMLGYSPDQFRHYTDFTNLLHPDDAEPAMQAMRDHLEGRDARYHTDYRIRTASGDYRWFRDVGGITRRQADGTPATVTGIVIDITASKQAEEKLRESEERYLSLFNRSLDAIYFYDPMGNFLDANQSALDLVGYTREDLPAVSLKTLLSPDQLGNAMSATETILREGTHPGLLEYRLKCRDGRFVDIETKGTLILHEGKPYGIFGIARDITQRKLTEKILQEEEAKYHRIYETALEGIWGVDEEFRVTFVNPKMADMLGYPVEEILGHPVTDFVAAGEQDNAQQQLAKRRMGLKEQFERRYVRKDGTIITLIVSASPVFGDDGSFKGSFAMFTDITERKHAEETLRESENRFRALIQNASDVIRILDRNGIIVYESDSAEKVLGYPPGFAIGRDPMEFIHPDDKPLVQKELRNVYTRENDGIPSEFRVRNADGEYLWFDSIGVNLLDVPGVNGIVITTRPIQQRKEAEQTLNESRELLRLALEGADAAFWDWDLLTGKAIFSDRFYSMLGYAPGEFPATYEGWTALMHPDDREHVLTDLQRQIREKRPLCEIEYRLLSKDGDWTWILGRGKIVESDNTGNPVRLTGVNIDITNRRLMESEIRSLNTVLEQRVKDRTEALSKANVALEAENAQRVEAEGKLRAAYDEKVMLVKEIHHRVKNNLQIIISLLNLQSRYITDESALAVIRESQNRVRAMSLVHEKLYQSENVSKIGIKDYVRFLGTGLVQFYGAKSRGVRLTLDIGDVDATINTAIPLGLIVNELISNSLKYAFPDGKQGEITITVTKEGTALHIRYQDNGIGIPEALDWRNTKSLGLRLVINLVDQLNGTVELDRSSGTQFTMVLNEKE